MAVPRRQKRTTTVYSSSRTLLLDASSPFSSALSVPLSIFSSRLSGLQALVRYLHERRMLSFSEIGALLNRSPKTVWTTHTAAARLPFSCAEGGLTIPVARFATRILSPLETVVAYLLELGLTNAEAARQLRLDPRTTWTVKRRIERKQEVSTR